MGLAFRDFQCMLAINPEDAFNLRIYVTEKAAYIQFSLQKNHLTILTF